MDEERRKGATGTAAVSQQLEQRQATERALASRSQPRSPLPQQPGRGSRGDAGPHGTKGGNEGCPMALPMALQRGPAGAPTPCPVPAAAAESGSPCHCPTSWGGGGTRGPSAPSFTSLNTNEQQRAGRPLLRKPNETREQWHGLLRLSGRGLARLKSAGITVDNGHRRCAATSQL